MYNKTDKITSDNLNDVINELFNNLGEELGATKRNVNIEDINLIDCDNEFLRKEENVMFIMNEITQFTHYIMNGSRVVREILRMGAIDKTDVVNEVLNLCFYAIKENPKCNGYCLLQLVKLVVQRNFKRSSYVDLNIGENISSDTPQYIANTITNLDLLEIEKVQKNDVVIVVKEFIQLMGLETFNVLIENLSNIKDLKIALKQNVITEKEYNHKLALNKEIENYLIGLKIKHNDLIDIIALEKINKHTITYAIDLIRNEEDNKERKANRLATQKKALEEEKRTQRIIEQELAKRTLNEQKRGKEDAIIKYIIYKVAILKSKTKAHYKI